MKFRAAFLGLCVAASTAIADPQTAARLRDQALADDTAWNILESLTTEIGPRPAGSPAAARARDWGTAKLTALGFGNVHVEPFAKRAWLRGPESGEVVGPEPRKLALLGLGNSPATPPGGVTGQVVVFGSLAALDAAPADCCAGKIVLVNQPMTRTQDGDGYRTAVAARSAAPAWRRRRAPSPIWCVRSRPRPTAARTPAPCGRVRPAPRSFPPPPSACRMRKSWRTWRRADQCRCT